MEIIPILKHALMITFFVFVMLPLLSYSIKDSVLVKLFNLGFGITIGGVLFLLGY